MTDANTFNKILEALKEIALNTKSEEKLVGKTPKGGLADALAGNLTEKEKKITHLKSKIYWEQFQKVMGVPKDFYKYQEDFVFNYFENLERSLKSVIGDMFPKKKETARDPADKPVPKLLDSIHTWLGAGMDAITAATENTVKELKNIRTILLSHFGKTSDSKEGKGIKIFENMIGFAAFAAGVYIIVAAMKNASDINVGGIIKATLAIGIFVFTFLQLGKLKSEIQTASISFGIFAATILFLVLPLLYGFAAMPIAAFIVAIFKLSIVFLGLIGVIKLMGVVKPSDLRDSAISFAIFAATIGFIILPMIVLLNKISWSKLLASLTKLIIIIGAIDLIISAMSMLGPDTVIKSSAGIGLFGLVVGIILLPLFESLVNTSWAMILEAIIKMGVVVGAVIGIMYLISKIPQQDLMAGAITVGLISIVLFALSFALNRYANMDWANIIKGMLGATIAITIFGGVLFLVGMLFLNPAIGPLIAVGAAVMLILSGILMGLALSMILFSGTFDWKKIGDNITTALGVIRGFAWDLVKTSLVMALIAIPLAAAMIVIGPLLGFLLMLALTMKTFGGDYNWELIAENIDQALSVIRGFAWGMIKTSLVLALIAIPLLAALVVIVPLMAFLKLLAITMQIFSGEFDWDTIGKNINNAMSVVSAFADQIVDFAWKFILKGGLLLAGLIQVMMISSIMTTIANGLEAFSEGFDWDNIRINIKESGLALMDFMEMITVLVKNSGDKMKELSRSKSMIDEIMDIMEKLADGFALFSDLNGEQIASVGIGLIYLGMGLTSYMLAISKLKNFDEKRLQKLIVGISLFEILNADKLNLVGLGLINLGMGLSLFFSALASSGNSILNIFKNSFLVDSIKKFEELDGDKLYDSGYGIYNLGGGLYWFMKYLMISDIKNTLNGYAVFGLLKLFQGLEGDKLAQVGDGLSILSQGLIDLSSNEINFDNVINQMKSLIVPLAAFSFVLDKFNKVYTTFGKVAESMGLDKKLEMNFQDQNGIQKAILDIQQQELEIQKNQLDQLLEQTRLLALIASKSGGSNVVAGGGGSGENSYTTPQFATKQNYMDALAFATMSLDSGS